MPPVPTLETAGGGPLTIQLVTAARHGLGREDPS
jgi:hypothetical protein